MFLDGCLISTIEFFEPGTDPLTNIRLPSKILVPNRLLKQIKYQFNLLIGK